VDKDSGSLTDNCSRMNEASACVVNTWAGEQFQGINPTVSHGQADASQGTPVYIYEGGAGTQ